MATLADLRGRLNRELRVGADADTKPWTVAERNAAIGDGYAELWRAGVWRPLRQSIATVDDTSKYALTAIREVDRLELLDTSSNIIEVAFPAVEDDGSGGYQLVLPTPFVTGYTMRVLGYGPYKSVFSSDADTDDLPAEHVRVPILKAKAICYGWELSSFLRYRERQTVQPEMNVTVDQMLGAMAAAERDFTIQARLIANKRPRVMRRTSVLA